MSKETIKALSDGIGVIKDLNQPMDSWGWGFEEGVLITGNQAEECLKAFKDIELLKTASASLAKSSSNFEGQLEDCRKQRDDLSAALNTAMTSLATYGKHPVIEEQATRAIKNTEN